MIKALLFDLDNTLLENDMETFIPAYLSALGDHMSEHFPPATFVRHIMRASNDMTTDTDPGCTNMEVFDAAFFPAVGRTRQELEPLFDDFYANRFPDLRHVTRPVSGARSLVEWALAQGFQVVIATNPLFPLTAIAQRLEWAGVSVDEFPYHLVTSYEDMHATKPHTAYYLEICQRLGREAEECLMVGDEWQMDVQPALALGMQAYWIAAPDQAVPEGEFEPAGRGSLADFASWIRRQVADL
jgi:FMN phosphatase YigB (HAD superfamily)